MGSTIPFRRKSSDIENQETEKKINGKDSVFKIVYKQVGSKIRKDANESTFYPKNWHKFRTVRRLTPVRRRAPAARAAAPAAGTG